MKQDEGKRVRKVELESEVIADLEPDEGTSGDIRGGQRPTTWCRIG